MVYLVYLASTSLFMLHIFICFVFFWIALIFTVQNSWREFNLRYNFIFVKWYRVNAYTIRKKADKKALRILKLRLFRLLFDYSDIPLSAGL